MMLTISRKMAKILTVSCKNHRPIETLLAVIFCSNQAFKNSVQAFVLKTRLFFTVLKTYMECPVCKLSVPGRGVNFT